MKLLNLTLIKLTLYFIIGIFLGYFFPLNPKSVLWTTSILIAFLGIYLIISKRHIYQSFWSGVLIFFSIISTGILTVTVHNQVNFSKHYSKQINDTNAIQTIKFKVREVLKSGNYYHKYVIDILELNNSIVNGKSLLNIEKSVTNTTLRVDDIIVTSSQFKALISPLNPHQFNYKNYLKKQQIYHQLFLTDDELLTIRSKTHTLFGFASKLRHIINKRLEAFNFEADELSITNALLLGQRQYISEDVYNNYKQAGAVHILAVSGLHIGIILLLLNFLFKPIEYIKHGKLIKTILLILFLWSFTIIAGLSASVVRAVTMFTIIAIAMNYKRPTIIYNTLAFSIFILLLFKPVFIFDVGFQLSYLAVFAIVTIHPMLYKIWQPNYKIVDFFWKLFTVTVSAQIGIIPISLYYFHQFPGLFFISNLIIIPCLGVLLGFGVLIIVLALLNSLPQFLASFYGYIISLMNDVVAWVAMQETFLFKHISFGLSSVIISYVLIVTLIVSIKKKTYKSIMVLLITILACQGFLIIEKNYFNTDEFIVFHKSRYSMIGIKTKNKLTLHHNLNDSILKKDNIITNFKVGETINNIKYDRISDVYRFNNKNMLVIDSLGIYNVTTFKPDIVLLRNSPKINLNRLIDTLNPELIISDGSNFKSYSARWAKTCRIKKRPFYDTSKKGAYSIITN